MFKSTTTGFTRFGSSRSAPMLSLFATVLAVSACSSGGGGGEGENQVIVNEIDQFTNELVIAQPELDWQTCEFDSLLDCAIIIVPMDYSDPTGRTIEVQMARIPSNPATKERTMFLNPGGPGGAGIPFLSSIRRYADVPNSLRRATEFVTFDPRGIGRSTSVDCDTAILWALDDYPVNDAEIQDNLDVMARYADDCSATEGDYIQHLGSYNVVRDMNEMRKAMRLNEIDFLGYSYGTRLAALFLQSYPIRSGRFVLDGSMTPDPSLTPLVRGALLPAQANIDGLTAVCRDATVNCSTATFPAELLARAEAVGAEGATEESQILFTILQIAATNPGYENLIMGRLAEYVATGDVEELRALDRLFGLSEGVEDERFFNQAVFSGVMCADDFNRPTLATIDAIKSTFNSESDLLAETYYDVVGLCSGWPEAVDPIPQIATNQAPRSLVIGGPTDAQTPLIFAEEMAQALGGHYLHSEHDGHTTTFTGQNQCTENAVEEFLLNGTLPTTSFCSRTPQLDSFTADFMPMYNNIIR